MEETYSKLRGLRAELDQRLEGKVVLESDPEIAELVKDINELSVVLFKKEMAHKSIKGA